MFRLTLVALALSSMSFALGQTQNQPAARKVSASARISWAAQTGVSRYRLQVARDQGFSDTVIDRAIKGNGYVISGLPEGRYYWRVAPIGTEKGGYSSARLVRLTKPKPKAPVETVVAKRVTKPAAADRNARKVTTPPRIERVQPKPETTARDNRTSRPAPTPSPRRDPGELERARVQPTPAPIIPLKPLPDNGGWRTVTGNIAYPVAAHLRSTSTYDLVGVNSNGSVYALDGTNGSALWTTRFRLNANLPEPPTGTAFSFNPVVFRAANGLANVVVAYDGGVRALEGASGAELWRTSLPAGALSGTAAEGSANPTIFIVSGSGQEFLLLNGDTGAIVGRSALLARPFGAPIAFVNKNAVNLVIVFDGGFVELRNMKGELVRSVKLANPTTPPVFVVGPRGGLVLVGTLDGLMALDAGDLHSVGRVAIEDDWPRGKLSVDDLDGDGAPEVVMITNRARVIAMNTTDGKIRWEADGATDAASAAFADLNGDGTLDVLVAAWPAFAVAFSGSDGSLIWRADEEMNPAARMPFGSGRSLVTAPVAGGSNAIVAGTDSYRKGFRAVGLPRGAIRVAQAEARP